MPEITDHPPQEIAAELAELSAALDDAIPPKVVDRNLIIATWNIWHLGGLTQAWRSPPDAEPKRDLHLGSPAPVGRVLDAGLMGHTRRR